MRISKETIEILNNFKEINQNILLKVGNELSTKSTAGNILAVATIDEYFEKEFGIYDLAEFLQVLKITNDADINITDKEMHISWGNSNIKYIGAEKITLTYPEKSVKMPDADVEFDFSFTTIKNARTLKSNNLSIISNGTNAKIKCNDKNISTSNVYEIDLDIEVNSKFEAIFDISVLRLIDGDYTVKLSKHKISEWSHKDRPVKYYIMMDVNSTFE